MVVIFACAASAGIHAGIVPEHLREEPQLGVAFIVAVVALLATAAAVALRPSARPVARTAALVLGGLILAYIASRTTGIPILAPNPEAVEPIGVIAVCVESACSARCLSFNRSAASHGGPSSRRYPDE
jgi:hypothetical protein